jgi:hypothetical protein
MTSLQAEAFGRNNPVEYHTYETFRFVLQRPYSSFGTTQTGIRRIRSCHDFARRLTAIIAQDLGRMPIGYRQKG